MNGVHDKYKGDSFVSLHLSSTHMIIVILKSERVILDKLKHYKFYFNVILA